MMNAENPPLPPLRQDLEIFPGVSDWNGAPTWLIHDKLRNRYFRIGLQALNLLVNWRVVTAPKLAKIVSERSKTIVSEADVEAFAKFLISNSLIVSTNPEAWQEQFRQNEATKRSLWKSAIHNYLFFRIPLFRPQRFLDATWPVMAPLFTRTSAVSFALIALFSLYLVSRQWSVFVSTFLGFLTLEGFLLYGVSLVFIKIIHELGHAFMARKYGCEVSVIGIAFIVMMPILYTDTTSAHRLTDRRKRLNIDLAGIYAELALASIATLFWVFLPDGPLRSVAFSTATLSWLLSIAVNLNPFMRFDGYYILSDLTGFENLQERSFALAKWRLREILFGLKEPIPEQLPPSWVTPLILHAWGTWIYRFFLFLGIAFLVYAFFIKLVGIFLFAVEILWFILMPIFREISIWWSKREKITTSRRSVLTFGVMLSVIALMVVPWSKNVSLPAIAKTRGVLAIFPADEGKVVKHVLVEGKSVKKGDLLAKLISADLEEEIARNRAETALLEKRLARQTADEQDQSLRLILEQELKTKIEEAAGLELLGERLEIRAPVSGTLVNVDTEIHSGIWLNPATRLAQIRPDADLQILALVNEANLERLPEGGKGRFIPENLQLPPIALEVDKIGRVAVRHIEDPLFADIYGGQVSVRNGTGEEASELLPRKTWFPVRLSAADQAKGVQYDQRLGTVQRGTVRIVGHAESFAARVGKRVASVLLREAGF